MGENALVEYKENFQGADSLGRYLSALSNSAGFHDADSGVIIFGVNDSGIEIGTDFDPAMKVKGVSLEMYLRQNLDPDTSFSFEISEGEHRLVSIRIQACRRTPVAFKRERYVRVGDATPRLSQFPEIERKLWLKGEANLGDDSSVGGERLLDGLLYGFDDGDGSRFGIRIVVMDGCLKTDNQRLDVSFNDGYLNGDLQGAFDAILSHASGEVLVNGRRRRKLDEVALREALVNMVAHQDLSVSGRQLIVEIYDDRVEFCNPGDSLVAFGLGSPSHFRNKLLVEALEAEGWSETRGTGFLKMLVGAENSLALPAKFESGSGFTRVTIFGLRSWEDMSGFERREVALANARLVEFNGGYVTNGSLRERFGLTNSAANQTAISKLLKVLVDSGLMVKGEEPKSYKIRKGDYE